MMQLCNEPDESSQKSTAICEQSLKPSALSFTDFMANVSTYCCGEEPKKLISKSASVSTKKITPSKWHKNAHSMSLNGQCHGESSLLNFLSHPSKEKPNMQHSVTVQLGGKSSSPNRKTTRTLESSRLSESPLSVPLVMDDIQFHSTGFSLSVIEIEAALDIIANESPGFPVQYCYGLLKNRLATNSSEYGANRQGNILWSEKYAPMKLSHLVSNGTGGLKLRRWLNRWQRSWKTPAPLRSKKSCGNLPKKTRNLPDADDSDDEFRCHKRRRTLVGRAQDSSPRRAVRTGAASPLPPDSEAFEPIGHRNHGNPGGERAEDEQSDVSDLSTDAVCSEEEEAGGEDTARGTWRSRAQLLVGPHGCGKTALVYALANELGFKVFEVNASTRRSGKDIASQFQVALGSQHVAKENLSTSFSTFHMTTPKGLNLSSNSLVLFDEVDVLFPSDRGFWSGLSNLLNLARRPIVLTASDPNVAQHLSFPVRIIRVHSPPQALLAPYLRLIALAEGSVVDKSTLEALVLPAHRQPVESVAQQSRGLDLRALLNRLQWSLAPSVSTEGRAANLSDKEVNSDDYSRPPLGGTSCLDYLARSHPSLFSLPGPQRGVDLGTSFISTSGLNDDSAASLSAVFTEEADGLPRVPDTLLEPTGCVDSATGPTAPAKAVASRDPETVLPPPKLLADLLEDIVGFCGHVAHLDRVRSSFDRARNAFTLEHCVEENSSGGLLLAAGGESTSTTSVNPLMTNSCCPAAVPPFDQLDGQLFSDTWPALVDKVYRSRLSTMEHRVPSRVDESPSVSSCRPVDTHYPDKHLRICSDLLRCGAPLGSNSAAATSSVLGTGRLAVANHKALICDYLPQLRTLAAGETAKQAVSTKRRFLHYFDRISLYLKRSTRKLLSESVFSSGTSRP